jgi:hypothetical protein
MTWKTAFSGRSGRGAAQQRSFCGCCTNVWLGSRADEPSTRLASPVTPALPSAADQVGGSLANGGLVESKMGAVAWGQLANTPFPPSRPEEFHLEHRVTGGGRPPPVPTERGMRISRTTLFGRWFTATASAGAPGMGDAALVSATLLFAQVSLPWSAENPRS